MNKALTAPFRAIKAAGSAAFNWAGAGANSVSNRISLVPLFLSGILWNLSAKFLDLAIYGYGGNSIAYACLRLLSQSIPEPPLLAFSVNGPDRVETPLPYDHPLCNLIRNPNPLMTEYEMWELMTLHMGIVGRSTWWKERANNGQIIALWPLRPDRVGPVYTTDTSNPDQAVITGWSYLIPGSSNYIQIRRQDMFFVNWPDPSGDSGGLVEGLGPLQVLASEVSADNEATRFVGALLSNSAIPGAVIQTAASLPTQAEVSLLKAAWNQEFGGMKRGSVSVLDANSKVTQMGFNLQQLEFPNLRRHTESRIAAAFGTPAILVGLQVGLESGIKATMAEQREYFAETTCSNYWRRYSTAFTRDVAMEFEQTTVCKFDLTKVKALDVQANTVTEKITEGFKLGAVTIDTYLTKVLGLPPLPVGGDHRMLPRGTIEVDAIGQVVSAAGIPGPAAPVGVAPDEDVLTENDDMDDVGSGAIPIEQKRQQRQLPPMGDAAPTTAPSSNGKVPVHA